MASSCVSSARTQWLGMLLLLAVSQIVPTAIAETMATASILPTPTMESDFLSTASPNAMATASILPSSTTHYITTNSSQADDSIVLIASSSSIFSFNFDTNSISAFATSTLTPEEVELSTSIDTTNSSEIIGPDGHTSIVVNSSIPTSEASTEAPEAASPTMEASLSSTIEGGVDPSAVPEIETSVNGQTATFLPDASSIIIASNTVKQPVDDTITHEASGQFTLSSQGGVESSSANSVNVDVVGTSNSPSMTMEARTTVVSSSNVKMSESLNLSPYPLSATASLRLESSRAMASSKQVMSSLMMSDLSTVSFAIQPSSTVEVQGTSSVNPNGNNDALKDRQKLQNEIDDLEEEVDSLTIAVAVVGAALGLVLLIVIVCCCIRRRSAPAERPQGGVDEMTRKEVVNLRSDTKTFFKRPSSSSNILNRVSSFFSKRLSRSHQMGTFSSGSANGPSVMEEVAETSLSQDVENGMHSSADAPVQTTSYQKKEDAAADDAARGADAQGVGADETPSTFAEVNLH